MDSIRIREVWNDNLEVEFSLIREIVDHYPYIAIDTAFPGFVFRSNENNYKKLKSNIDLLKLIQLGLTFSDDQGNLPTCGTDKFCVWQFNFREFNKKEDVQDPDSINLLSQSGIDFEDNNENGVDGRQLGELLRSSRIVSNNNLRWISFHAALDFAYLFKLITCRNLPDTQDGFLDWIKMHCPIFYDIKYLMRFCDELHGGLNNVAEHLNVERISTSRQAGSDSLLTSRVCAELTKNYFKESLSNYAGVLFGLGG